MISTRVSRSISEAGGAEYRCLLCSAVMWPWLKLPADWRQPQKPDGYELYWCDRCQFGLLHPRPDPSAIRAFYDIDEYYTHNRSESERQGSTNIWQRIREMLASKLDFGCELTDEFLPKTAGRQVGLVL